MSDEGIIPPIKTPVGPRRPVGPIEVPILIEAGGTYGIAVFGA